MHHANARYRMAAAIGACALAVAVSACGSGTSSTSSTTTNAGGPVGNAGGGGGGQSSHGGGPGAPPKPRTTNPRPRHRHQGPPGSEMHNTYPGRILSHELAEGGPVQPAELWPVTNGWQISDHRTFTAVYAGANPERHSTGRLVIFRQNFVRVTQNSDRVDIPGAGPVQITSAPLGSRPQTSAQRDGTLRFTGKNGTTGTLHLSNDTVTIDSS
jgi:hypothetical protein